jgi:carbon monoxide dehydrogenase subunit G
MIHSGTFLTTRSADEVFDLLANPERFAPLLPDLESMAAQDTTHFTVRIVIAVGEIRGRTNLAMELREAVRPSNVRYAGQGVVAGSMLDLKLRFQVASVAGTTGVTWEGEFSLDGMLALMAAGLIESMGRTNFERMAKNLQNALHTENLTGDKITDLTPGI